MNNKFELTKITDPIFGNLIKLQNKEVELHISIDYGPRILHFSKIGMDNMFYRDKAKKDLGDKFDVYDGDILKLYGGHRVWISPEVMPSTYHPDNSPVVYTYNGDEIVFTAPIEKFNNIQKSLKISMTNGVTITNCIKNTGGLPITLAPWAITMLDAGGLCAVPQPNRKTGYLANRNYSLWDYTNPTDERLYIGEQFITLTQSTKNANPFKFGYNNEHGKAYYFNKEQLFIKEFDFVKDVVYPDNGCNFEMYTCDFMLEMENLGAITTINPSKNVCIIETWKILYQKDIPDSKDEQQLQSILKLL